ncbi:MAG: glycoside hydrolase family 2 [Clostridiales bacterium]|nr:glycoside hydrolase family 2 [Clostridiales bacterium]
MKKISLNGLWQMRAADDPVWIPAQIPGSVYSALLAAGRMEDPYYRDNELQACRLLDRDYVFERVFTVSAEEMSAPCHMLVFHGLDTLADIRLNGVLLGHADNMHRTWKFRADGILKEGENRLSLYFSSPNRYVAEEFKKTPAFGSTDCTQGFPLLRKAHCMFGWDWGPRLPDAGIWRDAELLCCDTARLDSVLIRQKHQDGAVTLSFRPDVETVENGSWTGIQVTVTSPEGKEYRSEGEDIRIDDPALWWPNGYGGQPLYQVSVSLMRDGRKLDDWHCRTGLRTMTVTREKDEYGESFAFTVNGVRIFAMGGDYIPEDNILQRVNPERTRRLIEDCRLANYNAIRVWGGGYYPDDWFYDACDEAGLIVWQDFMFACALYELTPAFEENIRAEFIDNIRRLRHHPALGLWCGNNEMEQGVSENWYDAPPAQRSAYIQMYEYIIPHVLRAEDPDAFYWPASPSSGGGLDEPNDPNRGDVHYWAVWHGNKPFTDYRNYFFRYVSEFGFQSFPCMKTVESFTLPEDRNIFSYVMEKHQRNNSANGKIMNYLSQTFLYPGDFDTLLYASQLLQAEAIRYGVEHWRRNRGRCMGAIYWQTNDCWPVASWASIDYFGRWKALHYYARRFFAPVLLSCQEEGTLSQDPNVNAEPYPLEKSARLNISNETTADKECEVSWSLRDPGGNIIRQGSETVTVPALSAKWLEKQDFSDEPLYDRYFSYTLRMDGQEISHGSVLFCAPKHFHFADPHLTCRKEGDELIITADAYARAVEITCGDQDVLFSDNCFDMDPGEKRIKLLRGDGEEFTVRSVWNIR